MTNALILTAPSALTNPLPNTPKLRMPGDTFVLTSDSFSGGSNGPISTRVTDCALGGSPMVWATNDTPSLVVEDGRLKYGARTRSSLTWLDVGDIDLDCEIRVSLTLVSMQSAGALYFDMFRDNDHASQSTKLRATLSSNGWSFQHSDPVAASTTIPGAGMPVVAGANYEFRYNNRTGTLTTMVNGVQQGVFETGRKYSGRWFGLAVGADIPGFVMDNYKLTQMML